MPSASAKKTYFDRLKKNQASLNENNPNYVKTETRVKSAAEKAKELTKNKVDKYWVQALKTCQLPKYCDRQRATVKTANKPWKTIRLFISSTFHDFQNERDILIKKVFPDLRTWCKERKLHLVEIDLRWGVPSGSDAELALQTCLGEIERCYKENTFPFFLNMVSERVGWIPTEEDVTPAIRQYDWVNGLSITEMESLHGAFRCKNPNAFFLLRNPSFLQSVPNDIKPKFVDENPLGAYKASKYRESIENNFPDNQRVMYYAKYSGKTDESGVPVLTGFEPLLIESCLNFFKTRISAQYPVSNGVTQTKWQELNDLHEAFKDDEASFIADLPVWNNQIHDLQQYLKATSGNVPYILTAVSGSGKSSCLATFLNRASKDFPDHKIFYHFVGAVPGSVNYTQLLKRLAVFFGLDESKAQHSIEESVKSFLNTTEQDILIVVDAYNQLDEMSLSWVPCPLNANVKIIITGRQDVAEFLQKIYASELNIMTLKKMDQEGQKKLVQSTLGKFNKTLDNEQLDSLLSKESSSSYYWLSLACEELRIFGHFSLLSDKITNLPDDLIELQAQILRRLEGELENRSWLLVATLCLLVTCKSGLLEDEILQVLAEPPSVLPEHLRNNRFPDKIALKKWREISRAIRPFVKSNGDTAENRLNIYHSTFKQAVLKMYFNEHEETSKWFHSKLANYFGKCQRMDRKLEEYPFHLAVIGDKENLADFLCIPEVLTEYFNPIFSKELIQLWGSVDPECKTLASRYTALAEDMIEDSELLMEERMSQILRLAEIVFQNGKYADSLTILDNIGSRMELINDSKAGNRVKVLFQYQQAKTAERQFAIGGGAVEENQVLEIQRNMEKSYGLLKRLGTEKRIMSLAGDICDRNAMLIFRKAELELKDSSQREKFLLEAFHWIESAEKAYLENDDMIGFADCQTSRGICHDDIAKKGQCFTASEKLLEGGGLHSKYGRLCRNKGRFLQSQGDISGARKYFQIYYENAKELYGESHPETKRSSMLLDSVV